MTDHLVLPGRLGNPDMTLAEDPRADPRMIATLAPMGLAGQAPGSPIGADAPIEDILRLQMAAEEGFSTMGTVLTAGLDPVEGVIRETEVITGVDGNDITLFVHRPASASEPCRGLLHLHGGGMAILEAAGPGYQRWRDELASRGLVVVGVEFRNAAGKLGPHPFPAGLNDCSSGLAWFHENRDRLGVDKIVVSGESGGGNLTLATTLKAKADGNLDRIAGVYAQCPYISNLYGTGDPNLVSLEENAGYFLGGDTMAVLARTYSPDGSDDTNPLAWPYHATVEDLTRLPPHVVSVNELDPLRDEGLAYYRKLLAAGVSAVGRTVHGTCHAGDCLMYQSLPDVVDATLRDIVSFANGL